jgi:hypothetical protein
MPKVPDLAREKLTVQMNALIDSYFKPTFVKPPPPASLPINYVIDVYTKWFGQYMYLCAKYQAPGRDETAPASTFETKFARLRFIGEGRIGLAFARPSGAWVELFSPVSLEECFQILQEDSHFEP